MDVYPVSNLYDLTYYQNVNQVDNALNGCYNGMQKPLYNEWMVTELRSDNSIMGNPTSSSSDNRELSDLDMFMPATSHSGIYDYWQNTYYNIYNVNKVLYNLAVNYHETDSTLTYDSIQIPVNISNRRRIAAEATFIRAYHYYNLVRLYGGVFLIHRPVSPAEAKLINRSSVTDIYKLIIKDLENTIEYGNSAPYSSINVNDLGRANSWAAKALLAKVYLSLGRKSDAAIYLNDIISNSGYGLQPTYAQVFSTTNEMNAEIMFAVRYKSGKVGLGSPFANLFAPNSSGLAVVNGDGHGYNYPAVELNSLYNSSDPRKSFNIKTYISKLYVNKYISNLIYENDGENDWPVIRYADVLLMLAEAQGFSLSSIALINQIRTRVGLANLGTSVNTVALFETALSTERRFEFAYENQRWFDLIRFNTTMQTITAEQTMKDHFAYMYTRHYDSYPPPALTLAQLQAQVTTDHLLLPIPQREIDTNTNLVIPQNPGY
ncbi:MAG: RagB/SusD family nutrient uptake outer membrane protein [Bacteroidota bacterium]